MELFSINCFISPHSTTPKLGKSQTTDARKGYRQGNFIYMALFIHEADSYVLHIETLSNDKIKWITKGNKGKVK